MTSELRACCWLSAKPISLGADSLGAVVYVAEEAMKGDGVGVGRVREICGECVGNNGGILPGLAEGKLCLNNVPETETEIETGGYEDFETWVEIEGIDAVNEELKRLGNENNDQESSPFHLPITVLVVPELPKMALVEVELAGGVANARASKILGGVKESSQEFVNNDNGAIKVLDGGWDLGYNSTIQGSMLKTKAKINAKTKTRIRLLEKCMCAVWGTTTTVEEGEGDVTFEELETCLLKIFGAMANSVKNEAMMNSSESCLSVRLWHKFDEEGVVKDAAQRALGRVSGLEEAALSIAKGERAKRAKNTSQPFTPTKLTFCSAQLNNLKLVQRTFCSNLSAFSSIQFRRKLRFLFRIDEPKFNSLSLSLD